LGWRVPETAGGSLKKCKNLKKLDPTGVCNLSGWLKHMRQRKPSRYKKLGSPKPPGKVYQSRDTLSSLSKGLAGLEGGG